MMTEEHKRKIAEMVMNDYDLRPSIARFLVNTAINSVEQTLRLLNESGSDCILDKTDTFSRGAGRAVDDEICEGFLEDIDNDNRGESKTL